MLNSQSFWDLIHVVKVVEKRSGRSAHYKHYSISSEKTFCSFFSQCSVSKVEHLNRMLQSATQALTLPTWVTWRRTWSKRWEIPWTRFEIAKKQDIFNSRRPVQPLWTKVDPMQNLQCVCVPGLWLLWYCPPWREIVGQPIRLNLNTQNENEKAIKRLLLCYWHSQKPILTKRQFLEMA